MTHSSVGENQDVLGSDTVVALAELSQEVGGRLEHCQSRDPRVSVG
jgi:hypothetical protein